MTIEAPSTTAVPVRQIPGESGTWVFLFGDMLVFGAFFATFMVERAIGPRTLRRLAKDVHLGVGVTNTLVLLTSSLCVVVALGALRSGAGQIARSAVMAATACGGVFIALKVFEYYSLVVDGHGVGANRFYMYYFILTGVHLLHVCVGMGILTFLLTQARRRELSETRMSVVEDRAVPIAVPGGLMTGPSAFTFVRGRAGTSWLVLIVATLISYALGAEHGTGSVIVVVVLAIVAIKVRLVGLDFMELRSAPMPLRLALEGYCLTLWAMLSGLYLFG